MAKTTQKMKNKDFCIFILTHGRPNNVITYNTLNRQGCTYPIYLIIDNEDKTAKEYHDNFGKENVVMFNKLEISKTFDTGDNFDNRKCIIYARNATFEIAEKLGYKYFIQLDDDYSEFKYRINDKGVFPKNKFTVKNNIDGIFDAFLDFYKSINAKSIAMSQGGDWFAGESNFGKIKRKCMNSFFCSIDRPFKFVGRINEDVNTYTSYQSKGNLFLTIFFTQLDQQQTQSNEGGMTETYLDNGTYLKSFYSVMYAPSCVRISKMGEVNMRLHHRINWDCAVPKIVSEDLKKQNKEVPF